MNNTCVIEDCSGEPHIRGLCFTHYNYHNKRKTVDSVGLPPKVRMVAKEYHRLSDKNTEAMTATCSVCGPVELKNNGSSGWECKTKRVQKDRARYERKLNSKEGVKRHRYYDPETYAGVFRYGPNEEFLVPKEDIIAAKKKFREEQGNRCALCGIEGRRMHLDHCHTTGKLRGLLCFRCNIGLGNFNDDPTLLLMGIDYLKNS